MRGAKAVARDQLARRLARAAVLIGQRIRLLADEKGVSDRLRRGRRRLRLLAACAADDPGRSAFDRGRIGVVSAGFGFQDLIARIGVERRVHTSGERRRCSIRFGRRRPRMSSASPPAGRDHDGFGDCAPARRQAGARTRCCSAASSDRPAWPRNGPGRRAREMRSTLQALRRQGASAGDQPRRRLLSRRPRHGTDGIGPTTLAALEERLHWQRFGL